MAYPDDENQHDRLDADDGHDEGGSCDPDNHVPEQAHGKLDDLQGLPKSRKSLVINNRPGVQLTMHRTSTRTRQTFSLMNLPLRLALVFSGK